MAPGDDKETPLVTKSGEIITDEIAERLADEAEAGYDVEMLRRLRRRHEDERELYKRLSE